MTDMTENMTAKFDARKLGRDDQATQVIELAANDVITADTDGSEPGFASNAAKYHSVLAMEAARKMRRTRQKKKTGQEVCHHLKMMLATEPANETRPPEEGQFKLAI